MRPDLAKLYGSIMAAAARCMILLLTKKRREEYALIPTGLKGHLYTCLCNCDL